ncbi:zinc finger protein 729 [Papilio machaon]|uniref:zinc finger protein 729 n=1 Tax=Papilio machaon TaxID=76193 RepID=UPI001E6657A5|nr:zinc finger protein 729 [Papilio machaon]
MSQNPTHYVCDYCSRTFTRKYNLQTHIENYHMNSSCYCEICDQRFGSPAGLQLHLSRGHNRFGQAFPECDICGRIFTRKQNITSHMITVHLQSGRPDIRCHLCEKTFTTERNLKRHKNQLHNPNAEYPICDMCKKVFKSKSALITHIVSTHQHVDKDSLKCQLCSKVYTNNRNLKRHVEMFHGERGEFKCPICPKVYTSNQSLRRHNKTMHNPDSIQFNCQICCKEIYGKENIDEHVILCTQNDVPECKETEITSEPMYNCTNCEKSFNLEPLLRHHVKTEHTFQDFYNYCKKSLLEMMTQTPTKDYICEFCNNTFNSLHELKDHLLFIHEKYYNLSTCNVCFTKFSTNETLLEHRKFCLPPPDVNACEHCDRLFTDIASLEFHMKIFHPQAHLSSSSNDEYTDQSYKCEYCDRVYNNQKSLNHHIKLKHNKEQSFDCHYCGKVCSNKYYLTSHIKIVHSNISCSKCDYCDKWFKSKRNIRRHIEYTHLGMQRHKCIECETLFKEKRSLRKHVRIKHPNSTLFPQCHICYRRFESAKSCKVHLKLIHSFNLSTHPCGLCSISFSSIEALKEHLETNHLAEDEIYKCDECNLLFKGQNKFDQHKEIYHSNLIWSGKRKSVPRCVICMKDFSSRKTLKRHIKKFHNEFDVDDLANYSWLVKITNVDCDECIKIFTDDLKNIHYDKLKESLETIVYKCDTCLTSYNMLEYSVLRHKLNISSRGKMILSEFCTAELSEGEDELNLSQDMEPESTTD